MEWVRSFTVKYFALKHRLPRPVLNSTCFVLAMHVGQKLRTALRGPPGRLVFKVGGSDGERFRCVLCTFSFFCPINSSGPPAHVQIFIRWDRDIRQRIFWTFLPVCWFQVVFNVGCRWCEDRSDQPQHTKWTCLLIWQLFESGRPFLSSRPIFLSLPWGKKTV